MHKKEKYGFKVYMLRYCFNCRKPLDYRWYVQDMNTHFSQGLKLKIWNDKRFQLFCCSCYSAIEQNRLKIRNKKLSVFYKFNTEFNKKDTEPKIRDIIRSIDPIDYRTLDWFTND